MRHPVLKATNDPGFWFALAVSLALYAALIASSHLLQYEKWAFYFRNVAIWIVNLLFLFIYLRSHGHRLIRHPGDEIKVLPRYRRLVVMGLFQPKLFNRLAVFYLLTLLACLAMGFPYLIIYLFLCSGAYFGLIAIYIMTRLGLTTRRAAIARGIFWAGSLVWVPAYVGLLITILLPGDEAKMLGSAFQIWVRMFLYLFALAFVFWPLVDALSYYGQALKAIKSSLRKNPA